MRKKVLIVIISALLVITLLLFGYFNHNKITRKPYENTSTAEYLFNLKTPYIGDNSSVGKLLDSLDIGDYGNYTFSLITSNKPYVLTITYSKLEGLEDINLVINEKSAILLALIDNADQIEWVLPNNKSNVVTIDELNIKYGNIKDYGSSVQNLNKLLIKLEYNEDITISIKNITNEEVTLLIKNGSNNKYLYDDKFIVERREDNKWISVDGVTNNFNLIEHELKSNSSFEQVCSFGISLSSGYYRIIKTFNGINGKKYIISVEFEI